MPRWKLAVAAIGLAIFAPTRDWKPPSRPSAAIETSAPALELLPVPAALEPGRGRLAVEADFSVALRGHAEPRLEKAAERFLRRLADATGLPIRTAAAGGGPVTLTVHCGGPGEPVQSPAENESYSLRIRPDGARLESDTPVGVLRGLETLIQLVTPDASGFAAPEVVIRDAPRFAWRGLMIDVARRWQPMEILKRNLDAMAAVKLNVLHLHLSDDHGFRVESRRFPKLHELGSGGLYYTQDQIRDLVDKELATGATQLTDLHVWRVGQHAYACALSIATHDEKLTADQVRRHLAQHEEIVHVTVEVNRCCG